MACWLELGGRFRRRSDHLGVGLMRKIIKDIIFAGSIVVIMAVVAFIALTWYQVWTG